MIQKPERLRAGDRVAVITPAGPPREAGQVEEALDTLTRLGFVPAPGRHLGRARGYLAGTDAERLADLHRAFAEPAVRGIFCLRGGYGSGRLLESVDYRLIRRHPKVVVGFSDLTALQTALLRCSGLASFHGPVLSQLQKAGFPADARALLLRLIQGEGEYPLELISQLTSRDPQAEGGLETVRKGVAGGRPAGGNLAVLTSLIGTRYWTPLRGKILFLEEVAEAPYRIDRMLTQLRLAGLLDGVAGIVVGACRKCGDPGDYPGAPDWREVFRERLASLKVPLLLGAPIGHIGRQLTLPTGLRARLDAGRGELWLLERPVR